MTNQTGAQPIDPAKLEELIDVANKILQSGTLTKEHQEDLQTHVDTLGVQSRARVPNHTIIRESLHSMRTIAEDAGAVAVLGEKFIQLLEALGVVALG